MKVAIYSRVSTDDQNVDRQDTMLREYCRRHEHEIYKAYKDVYSGSKSQRPDFNIMLDDMREFRFEAILVTKLDRLGRSLQHLLGLFDEMNNKRIKFVAITQNIDTSSSMGMMQMQMMGVFAEFERNIISERTKEALKGNLLVGKRGPDLQPRKKRGRSVINHYKVKKETKNEAWIKKFTRTCKRCRERFKTKHHSGKVCQNCRGGTKKPQKT